MPSFARIAEAVAQWRQARCDQACPTCPRNCCSGRLSPRIATARIPPIFAHLPVCAAGTPLPPRPYLEERRAWRHVEHRLLGACPHLEDGRCGVYGHPDRPGDCLEYPVHLQRILGGLGGTVLHAEESCPMLLDQETRQSLEALAATLGLELLYHPAQPAAEVPS